MPQSKASKAQLACHEEHPVRNWVILKLPKSCPQESNFFTNPERPPYAHSLSVRD